MLTTAQARDFERDGFLVVEDFIDAATCRRLRRRAVELVEAWEPSAARTVFTTDEQARVSDREFLDSGPRIWCFFEAGAFDDRGDLVTEKATAINKIGHALHDPCMWAEPGGHRGPLRQLFKRNDADDPAASTCTVFERLDTTPLPQPPPEGDSLVPLEVRQGTLVVLHGLLPHWSAVNRSGTSRHAYTLHCISGQADYPAWNWLQRPATMPLRPLGSVAA